MAAANPHTIVVLETGGPVLMPWLDKTAAVLEAWYPGIKGADAIADMLFGDVNPQRPAADHLPRFAGPDAAPDAGRPVATSSRAGPRSTTTSKARMSAIAGTTAKA